MKWTRLILLLTGLATLLLAGCADQAWQQALQTNTSQAYLKYADNPDARWRDEAKRRAASCLVQEDEAAWSAARESKSADKLIGYLKTFDRPRHGDEAKAEAHRVLAGQGYFYEKQLDWQEAADCWQRLYELDETKEALFRKVDCEHNARCPVDYTDEISGSFLYGFSAVSLNIHGEVTSLSKKPITKLVLKVEFCFGQYIDAVINTQFVDVLGGRPLQPGETRSYRRALNTDKVNIESVKKVTIDEIM